jgi:hypothetical protein
MAESGSRAKRPASDVPSTPRSFEALEEQLRELRRSLGMEDGPAQVRSRPVPAAVQAPVALVPQPVLDPVLDPELDPELDPVLDAEPVPELEPEPEPELEPEPEPEPELIWEQAQQVSSSGPATLPAAGRRGLGADLFLLAGAWAGLILLVVFVLDRAS